MSFSIFLLLYGCISYYASFLWAYAKTWSGVEPWSGVMEWCGFLEWYFGVISEVDDLSVSGDTRCKHARS